MRLIKTILATAFAFAALSPAAHAEYPDKPIKILVGYAPGGAADKLIRPISDRLTKILKQPIIIDYKPVPAHLLQPTSLRKHPQTVTPCTLPTLVR